MNSIGRELGRKTLPQPLSLKQVRWHRIVVVSVTTASFNAADSSLYQVPRQTWVNGRLSCSRLEEAACYLVQPRVLSRLEPACPGSDMLVMRYSSSPKALNTTDFHLGRLRPGLNLP